MSARRELPVTLAIACAAIWGWAGARVALASLPLLAGLNLAAWRRERRTGILPLRGARRHDELTGFRTRAGLAEDLQRFLADRRPDDHLTLFVFDLVGFKKYNDAFGVAAGDALLRRLCRRLHDAVSAHGPLYRLRGAQVALTSTAPRAQIQAIRADAREALAASGEGFLVTCASGTAAIPRRARSLGEALKLADQEVQAERGALRREGIDESAVGSRATAGGLPDSPFDVTDLALAVGHSMGLHRDELDVVAAAVSWRDVGMMALPDGIVEGKGRLDDDERRFVALHTLVGERLLRANFGLDEVARVVRSSHERWDGHGYPDGLAHHEIPLAARIVSVCSAFQDMTASRAHRPARSPEQALAELRRHAGSQFDPEAVAAFLHAFGEVPSLPGAGVR